MHSALLNKKEGTFIVSDLVTKRVQASQVMLGTVSTRVQDMC
jgi:hypothetical protein